MPGNLLGISSAYFSRYVRSAEGGRCKNFSLYFLAKRVIISLISSEYISRKDSYASAFVVVCQRVGNVSSSSLRAFLSFFMFTRIYNCYPLPVLNSQLINFSWKKPFLMFEGANLIGTIHLLITLVSFSLHPALPSCVFQVLT